MTSDNYTEVSTYPGGGDWPDWARGTWYKGFAHREIPDTGVYKQMLQLPRGVGAQANEAVLGLGMAAALAGALSHRQHLTEF